MVGANYMGGKRNAARARTKDATGKAQRNHFGRQKLDILARGLGGSSAHHSASAVPFSARRAGPSDIALAHAQRDAARRRTPPNKSCAYSEPPAPRGPRGSDAVQSSPDRVRASRLLRALDTTQPIFMRTEMDRLRLLPDLAGLARSKPISGPHLEDIDGNDEDLNEAGGSNRSVEWSPTPSCRPSKRQKALDAPRRALCDRQSELARSSFDSSCSTVSWHGFVRSPSPEHPFSLLRTADTESGSFPLLPNAKYISQVVFQQISHAEDGFEPVPLDSSPVPRVYDDSGYVEFAAEQSTVGHNERYPTTAGYEPTRLSFYNVSSSLGSPEYSAQRNSSVRSSGGSVSASPENRCVPYTRDAWEPVVGHLAGSRRHFSSSVSPLSGLWSLSSHSRQVPLPSEQSRHTTPDFWFSSQLAGADDCDDVCMSAAYCSTPATTAEGEEERRFTSHSPLGPDSSLIVPSPHGSMYPAAAFSQDLVPPRSLEDAADSSVETQRLLDVLEGQLFEGDPWSVLDQILGLGKRDVDISASRDSSPSSPSLRSQELPVEDARRGVGREAPNKTLGDCADRDSAAVGEFPAGALPFLNQHADVKPEDEIGGAALDETPPERPLAGQDLEALSSSSHSSRCAQAAVTVPCAVDAGGTENADAPLLGADHAHAAAGHEEAPPGGGGPDDEDTAVCEPIVEERDAGGDYEGPCLFSDVGSEDDL